MSEIKVNSIKGVGASTAAITVNNSDGTCTANITNNLSNRNLIINGAMRVAQRGTTSTVNGFGSIDRWQFNYGGHDNAITQSQIDVAPTETGAGTSGFRNAFRITNGNQTSGFGASDYFQFQHMIEDQNIANSGWIVNDSNSNITVSYWIRSSVAQEFFGFVETYHGDDWMYGWSTGTLTADTWTKITKTIPGRSNLTWGNDNGAGLLVAPITLWGTTYTDSSVGNDAWHQYFSSSRTPDATSTWWTTNGATVDITGVQVEVGSVATDFEHRSFAQELALCQRYYEEGMVSQQSYVNSQQNIGVPAKYTTTKRATATVTFTDDATPSSGNVASVSSVSVHRNRVDGAFSYTDSSGAGNYYFYYIYKASAEL
jgi:hypothetical protein